MSSPVQRFYHLAMLSLTPPNGIGLFHEGKRPNVHSNAKRRSIWGSSAQSGAFRFSLEVDVVAMRLPPNLSHGLRLRSIEVKTVKEEPRGERRDLASRFLVRQICRLKYRALGSGSRFGPSGAHRSRRSPRSANSSRGSALVSSVMAVPSWAHSLPPPAVDFALSRSSAA